MKHLLSSSKTQTIVFGVISLALYALLFVYSEKLVRLAEETPHGNALYAIVPVIIAFTLSFVHGAFTGSFWDAVGLKASHQPNKK